MAPQDFSMRTATAAAERLNKTYKGRLVVNPDTVLRAVEGAEARTNPFYTAPEIIDGEIIAAVYRGIMGDPSNAGLKTSIFCSVERAHDKAQERSRIAAKDLGVKPRRPTTQIMYESPGGAGMAYDFVTDTISVTVPMALADQPKMVEVFVEEDTHAFTHDRAPKLFTPFTRTNKPKDIAAIFSLFVIEGIGQIYANIGDYSDNKAAVRRVGEGDTDFIRTAQSDPYVGGFLVLDTMKRAHGRKKAVNRAVEVDSPEEFLREYGLACKRLREPAINL